MGATLGFRQIHHGCHKCDLDNGQQVYIEIKVRGR